MFEWQESEKSGPDFFTAVHVQKKSAKSGEFYNFLRMNHIQCSCRYEAVKNL
jgi:hypothetical protein